MFFNVFEAAPENERDGPNQQSAQNASGKVATIVFYLPITLTHRPPDSASRIFPLIPA